MILVEIITIFLQIKKDKTPNKIAINLISIPNIILTKMKIKFGGF
jgi:hypothetical protein